MNPYHALCHHNSIDCFGTASTILLVDFPRHERPPLPADAPRALIFSPHPDDECIIGGLALRLLREAGMRVVNVAVTQGSRADRQDARGTNCKRLARTLASIWSRPLPEAWSE